jgi:uncharacterized protein YecE (DUF72 family)
VAPVQEERVRKDYFIGTIGWSYDFWVGNFYPSGTKPEDYLSEYAKRFNSVEINSSFYRIPSRKTVKKWAEKTPRGFVFTAKLPRAISHAENLDFDSGKLEAFIRNISMLGEKLGPLLIQLPRRLKPGNICSLENLLQSLPTSHEYAVEFGNEGWKNEETLKLLRELGVSSVQVEDPYSNREFEATAEFTYIRWKGDRKKISGSLEKPEVDRSRNLMEWALRVNGSANRIFGYFSKFYSGHPPSDVEKFLGYLYGS